MTDVKKIMNQSKKINCAACEAYQNEGVAAYCPDHNPNKQEEDQTDYWREREQAERDSHLSGMFERQLNDWAER